MPFGTQQIDLNGSIDSNSGVPRHHRFEESGVPMISSSHRVLHAPRVCENHHLIALNSRFAGSEIREVLLETSVIL